MRPLCVALGRREGGPGILGPVTLPSLPDAYDSGHLPVGDGHVLYYEQVGSRDGLPVVYVHGGPGSGFSARARRYFDLRLHRGILFDQRAAGRSTPHASSDDVHWASIDMTHHVADMERLRVHLGIDRWAVFGIS